MTEKNYTMHLHSLDSSFANYRTGGGGAAFSLTVQVDRETYLELGRPSSIAVKVEGLPR